MQHISLCILAYKRPDMLKRCLESIYQTIDLPHSIIVNLDGDDSGNTEYLVNKYKQGAISYLILNGGKNRGVGRSFQNCLGVAEGDYLFKVDADLTFHLGWASKAVEVLKNNPDVGAVSIFDYHFNDPKDSRFDPSTNHLETRSDCIIVKDFVSSIYGFRQKDKAQYFGSDDGFHQQLQQSYGKLAITKENLCVNSGFGMNSVYVSFDENDKPFKTPTFDEPLIFQSGLNQNML